VFDDLGENGARWEIKKKSIAHPSAAQESGS
jgi:hypothetical protein